VIKLLHFVFSDLIDLQKYGSILDAQYYQLSFVGKMVISLFLVKEKWW